MPRLHVWAGLASVFTAVPYGVYHYVYLPRMEQQQRGERVIEAARFNTQQLYQRLRNCEHNIPRTNAEKLKLYTELGVLYEDMLAARRNGLAIAESERLAAKVMELRNVRCYALDFVQMGFSWYQKLRSTLAYLLYCCWAALLPPILPGNTDLPQGIWRDMKCHARHITAKVILKLIDVECDVQDEEAGIVEAHQTTEWVEGLPPEKKPALAVGEDDAMVVFVARPRCWVEQVVLAASLPYGNKQYHHFPIHTEPPSQDQALEATLAELSPDIAASLREEAKKKASDALFSEVTSFGYPLPIKPAPISTTQPILYRPVLLRGVENVIALYSPTGVVDLRRRFAEERQKEIHESTSPYGRRSRRRDPEKGTLQRYTKDETTEEREKRLESMTFSRRLYNDYSLVERVHPWAVIPTSIFYAFRSPVQRQCEEASEGYVGKMLTNFSLNTCFYGGLHRKMTAPDAEYQGSDKAFVIRALIRCEETVAGRSALEGYANWFETGASSAEL